MTTKLTQDEIEEAIKQYLQDYKNDLAKQIDMSTLALHANLNGDITATVEFK